MAGISQTHDESWQTGAPAVDVDEAAPRSGALAFLAGPYPTLISRLVLGVIFLLAGLTKLGVPATVAASINSYQMPLPDVLVQAMAIGMPALELLIGVWLLIGLFVRFSAAVSAGLLLVFVIAIIQATLRGIAADCGCFAGAGGNPVGMAVMRALGPVGTFLGNEQADWTTVVRDLVFLAMAVHLFFVPSIFSIDNLRRRSQFAAEEGAVDGEEEAVAE